MSEPDRPLRPGAHALRVRVFVVGVAVVLLAMASALYGYLRGERSRAQLELTEVAGEVHIGRTAGDAEAARGTVLQLDDRVSTGTDGRAVLRLGRETQIRVGPESAVQITAIDEAGVSLELEDGLLQATVRPESGAVRVGSRGREVLATNGEFTVGVSDDVMQVHATQGTLSMSGVDVSRVDEGQQVTVVDRRSAVEPIPEELLLAVEWPAEARTRSEVTRVSGTTQPGASVRLRGSFGERTVIADRQGRFQAELPLLEGDNPIAVDATDLLGQSTTVEGMLQTRDTRGPSFRGGVDYRSPQ